ncbi:MAG TPA: (2Fe-2S) ferredoxin domain-containing protein [Methylocystis sp.]|nr:(2Fe-2S) ferredoxin domain-containing protein [Methylocystis sp.]
MKIPSTAPRLLVCVGPRCDEEGRGRALLQGLRAALGPRASCVPRDCLRLCTREPVVRIEATGETFANPSIDELTRLFEEGA